MRKMVLVTALILILLSILTACYDAREIDDWAYAFSIGIDKGVSNKLRMTLQIPTLKGEQSSGGQGTSQAQKNDFTVISLDCPTFYAGVDMINTSLSRKVNYTHSKFFIISEELAREDIGYLMSAFVRDRQIRRTMHMIIVKGQAMDFIREFNPVVGTAISKTQEGMMDMEDETGLFDDTNLGNFLDAIKSSKIQPTAVYAALNEFKTFKKEGSKPENFRSAGDYHAGELPRKGGNKTEYLGSAIFDGGKMVDVLNGDETRALLFAKSDFKNGTIALPDPSDKKYIDTIIVRQLKNSDIKVVIKNHKPIINLKIFLEGEIQALQTDVEYENPKKKPILENAVKKILKEELDKTISKCKQLNCDIFGFGEKASMKFLTIQEWEKYNWLRKFKEAEVTTEVEFTIRRTGTLIRTNPVKSSGGQK